MTINKKQMFLFLSVSLFQQFILFPGEGVHNSID